MIPRRGTGVLGALAGVLVVWCCAGCAPSPSPSPSAGAASPPPPAAAASSSSTPQASTSATDVRPEAGRCRLDDLSAQRGDGAYVAGRNQVRVIWTNRSTRTCIMDGFGGVDLVDAQGERVSATRSDEVPTAVSLPPGGNAHSTISYPAAGGTGVLVPRTILATPPDETRSARLAWGTGGVPTFEAGSEVMISSVRPGVS